MPPTHGEQSNRHPRPYGSYGMEYSEELTDMSRDEEEIAGAVCLYAQVVSLILIWWCGGDSGV